MKHTICPSRGVEAETLIESSDREIIIRCSSTPVASILVCPGSD